MHDWVLWVLVTASAAHVVEEHGLGWQGWASTALGPKLGVNPTWTDFWATNGLLVVFGISAAVVGWRAPAFALALPAVCIINAVAFHLVPSATAKRPNPGLFSGVALYIPISIWAYVEASNDHVLSTATAIGSIVIGAAAMAFPLLVLALSSRLRYEDV